MGARTTILFGTTGLVGKAIVEDLCKSDRYDAVKIFVRRASVFTGIK